YTLANEMGVDAIHDFMKPLGFGQITGIDLPGEVRGVLPSKEWKRKTYKRAAQQQWFAGETISLGIGQGYNNFTILQLSHALATLVNNGMSFTPHVGKELIDSVTGTRTAIVQPAPVNLGYKQSNVDAVKRGMVGVVTGGTGRGVFGSASYLSGGKTGTAQAVSVGQKEKYNAARLAEYQRDHSLYIAYGPAEAPRIAVAVIVENAGFGAAAAAPIARRILDYWLVGNYPSEADIAAVRQGKAGAPIGTPRRVEDISVLSDDETAP
ncbi:penicillin-binding transpeptidase domain-containing protein, partial [Comamonas thiooxydans]